MTGDFDYEFYTFDISAISSMRDALSVNTTIEELDIRNNGYFIFKILIFDFIYNIFLTTLP